MIPRTFHFIYLYGPNTREFDINHFISVKSNIVVNQPKEVIIWTNDPERLKTKGYRVSELTYVDEEAPTFVYIKNVKELEDDIYDIIGFDFNEVPHMAHQADILRLYIMNTFGGVYSDVDSVAYSPLPDIYYQLDKPVFWTERFTESPDALCNGFFMSPVNSQMLSSWLFKYQEYSADECMPGTPGWTKYSVQLGWQLYKSRPELVYVSNDALMVEPFYLGYSETCKLFFINRIGYISCINPHQIHLWETRNRDILKVLDEDYFRESDATYAQIGRLYI